MSSTEVSSIINYIYIYIIYIYIYIYIDIDIYIYIYRIYIYIVNKCKYKSFYAPLKIKRNFLTPSTSRIRLIRVIRAMYNLYINKDLSDSRPSD
jgi:hypothetical protein